MGVPSRCCLLAVALSAGACAGPDEPGAEAAPLSLARVEIGLPGGSDGLDFVPLEPEGVVRLKTFGQGGTHIYLGVRAIGFGHRAFVAFALRNLNTGAEIIQPAPARPQLLYCIDDQVCDLVPVTVMTSGLTEPDEEREGLPVEVVVDVHNETSISGTASTEMVLSTADL